MLHAEHTCARPIRLKTLTKGSKGVHAGEPHLLKLNPAIGRGPLWEGRRDSREC